MCTHGRSIFLIPIFNTAAYRVHQTARRLTPFVLARNPAEYLRSG
jgi:hypothetical protein